MNSAPLIRVKQYDGRSIRDIVEVSPDTLETYLKAAVTNLIEGVNSRIEIDLLTAEYHVLPGENTK